MNAALCVAQENHGSRQLGAEAAAAADLHLSVPPIRALPLLRRSRPHDRVRLPIRRGDIRLCCSLLQVDHLSLSCVDSSLNASLERTSPPPNHLTPKLESARAQNDLLY